MSFYYLIRWHVLNLCRRLPTLQSYLTIKSTSKFHPPSLPPDKQTTSRRQCSKHNKVHRDQAKKSRAKPRLPGKTKTRKDKSDGKKLTQGKQQRRGSGVLILAETVAVTELISFLPCHGCNGPAACFLFASAVRAFRSRSGPGLKGFASMPPGTFSWRQA